MPLPKSYFHGNVDLLGQELPCPRNRPRTARPWRHRPAGKSCVCHSTNRPSCPSFPRPPEWESPHRRRSPRWGFFTSPPFSSSFVFDVVDSGQGAAVQGLHLEGNLVVQGRGQGERGGDSPRLVFDLVLIHLHAHPGGVVIDGGGVWGGNQGDFPVLGGPVEGQQGIGLLRGQAPVRKVSGLNPGPVPARSPPSASGFQG